MMSILVIFSRLAAEEDVVLLEAPTDFVGNGGFPLPTGYGAGASITRDAPFGFAIRSGSPHETTMAFSKITLSQGVTVKSVSFGYRQCTGFGTSGLAPNFTLSIAGSKTFASPSLEGFPYTNACPDGTCYSPALNVSLTSLNIKVPDDRNNYRISFTFNNNDQNIQLLLPMRLSLVCSGGPCLMPRPPSPTPNASAINVACVGDSITQGYLSTNGADYPHQLQNMLGSDYKVFNFGAGGRTMLKKGDNPYWRTGPLAQALASKPAFVVLMLGTNDAKFHNWGPLHAEFPVDYKSMIDEFAQLTPKPKILIMIPPPLYQNGRYGMNQTVINTLFPGTGPAGIRTIAKNSGLVEPIDLFSLWQAHCPVIGGTPGHAPNNTDIVCDWIATDGRDACHPSNEGYGKLAAAVKARIAP